MQKLLIVLAIQFCLPLGAELLHQAVPDSIWILTVVVIHAVCIGCALALMWPSWRWMFLAVLLAGVFWAIWLKVYLISQADLIAEFPNYDYTGMYYNLVIRSALLACFTTIVFLYHCQLTWQRTIAGDARPSSIWQFTSRSFLYYSGLAALTVGAGVGLYNSETGEVLGIALPDLCMIATTMVMFLHLFQRSINWLSLGCGLSLTGVLWLRSYDGTILEIMTLQERLSFMGWFLEFCTLTVLLYRWAGFRIVPRRELALNVQHPESP
jgi:hypothetical protein